MRREERHADDPSGIDILHLGRPGRHRGGDERVLRRDTAVSLAPRAAGRRLDPLLLSSGRVEHFQAAFYLRNGTTNGLAMRISIARERFVGAGLQEKLSLRNESTERLEVEVALEAEADFADIAR